MTPSNPRVKARLILCLALFIGAMMFVLGTRVDAAIPDAPPLLNNPNGDKVCEPQGAHIDGQKQKVITETIEDGLLIVGYCVKAGSVKNGYGPHYVTLDTPAKTVEITHPSGKQISHYVVLWIPEPTPPFDHNWEYAAPTCESLFVDYPDNLPNPQNANHVNIRITGDGQTVTLNWHTSGTWAPSSTFVYADHPQWPGFSVYTVEWTQVAESNYHWSGSLECGTPPLLAEGHVALASECETGVLVHLVNTGTADIYGDVRINDVIFDGGLLSPDETVTVTVPHDMLVAGDVVVARLENTETAALLGAGSVEYAGACPTIPPPPPPVFECEDGSIVEDVDDCPPPVFECWDGTLTDWLDLCPPEPPVTTPPTTEPPVTTPPTTEPPTTEPPVTEPPVTEPPATTEPEPQSELPKTGATMWLLTLGLSTVIAGLGMAWLARRDN